jgi:hypothetical protein
MRENEGNGNDATRFHCIVIVKHNEVNELRITRKKHNVVENCDTTQMSVNLYPTQLLNMCYM